MKVTFVKTAERRYGVHVERDTAPALAIYGPGYDDDLPHDLLHFVAEAEYGLDGGVFGDLASGGNARIFVPVDRKLVAKMWRKQRIKKHRLPDGRRSEELSAKLERAWRTRVYPEELEPIVRQLDALAKQWRSLEPGENLTLEWPRPEGRKHREPRGRRRPAARRR
jgi:hypothetical protein